MAVFAVALNNEGYGCGFYIWQAEDEEALIADLKKEWNRDPDNYVVQAWIDEEWLFFSKIDEEAFKGENYFEVYNNFS